MVGKDEKYISTGIFYYTKANFLAPYTRTWKYCISTVFDRERDKIAYLLLERPEQSTADTLVRLGVFPVGTEHAFNSLCCFHYVNTYAWPFSRCNYAVSLLLLSTCTHS